MTGSFQLQLDTATHVDAEINGGAEASAGSNVTLELALNPDAIEIKVWGQIDPDSPLNAALGVTEGEAAWTPAVTGLLVALEEGEGPRQLHVRVKDDVWNEATATTSIFVGTPTPLPSPRPRTGGGPPASPRPIERRKIGARSVLRLRGHGATRVAVGGRSEARPGSTPGLRRAVVRRSARVATATAGSTRVRLTQPTTVEAAAGWSLGRRLSDETQAAITLLL